MRGCRVTRTWRRPRRRWSLGALSRRATLQARLRERGVGWPEHGRRGRHWRSTLDSASVERTQPVSEPRSDQTAIEALRTADPALARLIDGLEPVDLASWRARWSLDD